MNMFALYFQIEANYRERSIKEHQEILEAIRSRNFREAGDLMKIHNTFALKHFEQN